MGCRVRVLRWSFPLFFRKKTMRYLIVEDEPLAAERLRHLLAELDPGAQCVGEAEAVESAVAWLKTHPAPDLAFLDVQLADDLSFAIFEQTTWRGPVIFTTAYDAYALRAFKVNSIDYLLKPIDPEALRAALDKLRSTQAPSLDGLADLLRQYRPNQPVYKQRFLVTKGEQLLSVPVQEVLLFYAEDKVTFLKTQSGQRYIIPHTLGELETQLDPEHFFRINRGVISARETIEDVRAFFNRKLRIRLTGMAEPEWVSKEKQAEFKAWMGA